MLRKTFTKPFFLLFFIILNLSAEATTYYVSNSGNDNNSGTSAASPWQTLNKVNSFKFYPGDNILFNSGNTFYGSIIVTNSGSSGNPITYGAYGSGANPIISGFTNVTSWANKGGNIWESSSAVSTLSYCNIVSINGVNTPMGRYPNSGYLTYQSYSGNTSITSSSLTGSPNWTGADVAVKVYRWEVDRATIKSQSGGTLNLTPMAGGGASNNFGFFIENDIRTLDAQNEWYFNPSSKKISVYSIGQPSNVRVGSVSHVVDLSANNINYVVIDHLATEGSNDGQIYSWNGNYVNITNCSVAFSGGDGIYTGGNYSSVSNNVITDCSDNGIFLAFGNSGGHSVKYNVIKRTGIITGILPRDYAGSGIRGASQNSLIQYNDIDSSGYCGINFRRNNVQVRNNLVNHSGLLRDDAGGIYTGYANETGKIIDGNIILNSEGTSAGTNKPSAYTLARGIYIDEGGTSITISNNSVAYGNNSGIFIHNANNITVTNNTVYDNGTGNVSSSLGQMEFQYNPVIPSSANIIRGNVLTKNIFFSKTAIQPTLYYSSSSTLTDAKLFGTANGNYYAKPISNSNYINFVTTTSPWPGVFYSLPTWQVFSGQDAQSFATPKAITDTNDLRFEYNATSSNKTISLDANYIDVTGKSYNGSITLAPYSSAVLIKNGPLTSNQSPVANAGDNRTIQLPKNSIVLAGSGSDADGTIASYQWTKISGPSSGTILNPASPQSGFSNLVQGVYQLQLTVTDNQGATGTSTVTITVTSANTTNAIVIPNIPPIANAGDNRTIQLPKNSIVLAGSGSDSDGTIASYQWTKLSGPSSGTILNPTSPQSGFSYLVQGVYQLQLTVTDNNGATGTSTVTITVTSSNIPPIANAGDDRTIQLPKNSIVLAGSGSDADGTIVSYQWTKVSGPSSGTILNPTSPQSGFSYLVQGVYQLQLVVTDNQGATGSSTMQVTVTSATQARNMAQNTLVGRSDSEPNTLIDSSKGVTNNIEIAQNTESASLSPLDLKVFPNPFKNVLNITINGDAGKYKLILMDASGRILLNKEGVKNTGTIQLTENTSQFSDGMYFLEVIQNNSKSTIKLVRQ